ncbi:MAG TPA: hypothetical protein VN222_05490 [Novosphingobium sp.]|nr:hypothetical protein [Novosphingobium sp.]
MGERDPIMAQLRLAWWRDRLKEPSAQWPKGEPLLAALADWQDGHGVLVALVDGWEAMLAEAPLDMGAMGQLADGRVTACVAIASGDAVERMARGWALGEMLDQPAHPDETAALQAAAQAHDWRRGGLPRAMRPLAVLHGLAARHVKGKKTDTIGALIASMRLGLFGY